MARLTATVRVLRLVPGHHAVPRPHRAVREPYGVWGGLTEDDRERHYTERRTAADRSARAALRRAS
jgi:WhiB family redox-sensing transcriptional regulator